LRKRCVAIDSLGGHTYNFSLGKFDAEVVEWQTRTFEGRVGKPVRVQIPPSAPTFITGHCACGRNSELKTTSFDIFGTLDGILSIVNRTRLRQNDRFMPFQTLHFPILAAVGPVCSDLLDAKRVYRLLQALLNQGYDISLDFQGVRMITAAFYACMIGDLLATFPEHHVTTEHFPQEADAEGG
jgi:hypothetical protein